MRLLFRLIAFLALCWAAGLVAFVLTLPSPADDGIETDGIAVLTGGPGRLARGAELLSAGRAKRLLISGVNAGVGADDLAAENDISPEMFACCIDLGKRAADTRGNGREIAKWASARGYRSIRVVTSQYHMARAAIEIARHVPADVRIVEDPVAGAGSARVIAVEYSKFLVRWAEQRLGAGQG